MQPLQELFQIIMILGPSLKPLTLRGLRILTKILAVA